MEGHFKTKDIPHNEWIEAIWNMAGSEIRLQGWYPYRDNMCPSKFRQFIEKEEFIFDSWYRFGMQAKQAMDIRSIYN